MRRFDRRFFRDFWALIAPYWASEERWSAWGLLVIIVSMNLGLVAINVWLNRWMNGFYNALQNLDKETFLQSLLEFTWIAALFIVTAVYMIYLSQMLQIRWRTWLTDRYLDEWLRGQTYYRMQVFEKATDNPDQRISEDIAALVDRTLNLGLGLLRAVVTLVSFVTILWSLSGSLSIPLGGLGEITVPGYMVWAALLYAVLGTWLTARIGNPLITLNFNQQRFEADFRYNLVRIRENSESIAIYSGEGREKGHLWIRFKAVVGNFWQIMRQQKKLTWMTSTYNQLSYIFPLVVAAPRFFSGQIKLGGLMQISQAFGQVHESLSFIVNSYVGIAEWKAVVDRLLGFSENMKRVESTRALERIERRRERADRFQVEDLNLSLPDGRLLLEGLNFHLQPGDSLIVTGPSGCGKSTLMRALAGIWPYGEGTVLLPEQKTLMFLSQKPYLPMGSLREALFYPAAAREGGTEAEQILRQYGLAHLTDRLDAVDHWAQILSLGEQQRVAFARILLNRPDYIFLDEATSSLDEQMESLLYRNLRSELGDSVFISVGHRHSLFAYHGRHLAIGSDGAWRMNALPPGSH